MFRMWVKLFADNRLVGDTVICDGSEDTRTHKVLSALDRACRHFDLPGPIWLESTIRDFREFAKCRFNKDSFVEQIDFDYMELHVIEED
ncbi:MAG: hypothetical protein IKR68_08430 [Lachnospiraceae bacterium]|nr:hypothetical protein [Lachnospiraceae bacterium]